MNQPDRQHQNHGKIIELLPWFVNGTLDSQEREQVQHSIDSCDDCMLEFRQVQSLQQSIAGDTVPVPDAAPGLQAILGRIDRETAVNRSAVNQPVERKPGLLEWFADWLNPLAGVMVAASVLVVVVLVMQGGDTRTNSDYSVLSSDTVASAEQSMRFRLTFTQPTALVDTRAMIETALQTDNVTVEVSPDTESSFIVEIADGQFDSGPDNSSEQGARVKAVADWQVRLQSIEQVTKAELLP